jgi:hypothetical protein
MKKFQNDLKQDASSPLLFNFALEYAISKFQQNKGGLELNGTHQLLFRADNVNLLSGNTNIIQKNTDVLQDTSKEIFLDVNAKKTKCMFMTRHQTTHQNHYVMVANKFFENAAKLKYLGMTLTNQNCSHKEIRRRLNIRNVCDHEVQDILSSCLLYD